MMSARAIPFVLLALSSAALAQSQTTAPAAASPEQARSKAVDDLVTANHILADQGVLDGYGHVSIRVPGDPKHFLLARSVAPELVTAADILEHDLEGKANAPPGTALFGERFIHAAVYAARPDVQAVG